MKRRIQTLSIALLAMLSISSAALQPAMAATAFDKACQGNGGTVLCDNKKAKANNLVQTIIELLLWALGIISVIMIIAGGIRYAVSNGDATKVKAAKDTVLYAVVGLVVALSAYAIVAYVVSKF